MSLSALYILLVYGTGTRMYLNYKYYDSIRVSYDVVRIFHREGFWASSAGIRKFFNQVMSRLVLHYFRRKYCSLEDIYLVVRLCKVTASNALKLDLKGCFSLGLYLLQIMAGTKYLNLAFYMILVVHLTLYLIFYLHKAI